MHLSNEPLSLISSKVQLFLFERLIHNDFFQTAGFPIHPLEPRIEGLGCALAQDFNKVIHMNAG
jgi:hypothetical protein